MPALDSLSIEITANTSKATRAINKLAESLSKLGSGTQTASSVDKVTESINGLANSTSGVSSLSKTVRDIGSAFGKAGSGAENFTKHIGAVGESVSDMLKGFSEMSQNGGTGAAMQTIEQIFGKLLERGPELAMLAENIRSISEALKLFGKSGDVVPKIDATKSSMSKASGVSLGFAKNLAAVPLKAFAEKVKATIKPLANLFNSFKRIAMYRALRTAIKQITEGFKIGIDHLYAWAALVDNSFKGTMDSLATSLNYLRNSLGAMVSPLLDALAPAVDILVDKFVDLVNYVNQFFATITGATSWRRAVKQQKEYADETDKAASAHERLNHQLMAFDELNNITLSNPSGRGSGNKDDEVDDKSFVVEQLPDWAKDIKDAIDRGDWAGAGAALAEKLNGLTSSWDAQAWGEKLGKKVSNGLEAYNSFMETYDWTSLGKQIATGINGFLSKIDPDELGRALTQKISAALKFLAGFTPTVDLSPIGSALGSAFNNLFSDENIENMQTALTGAIKNVLGIAKNFVFTVDLSQVGKAIATAFNTLLSPETMSSCAEIVAEVFNNVVDLALGFFKTIDLSNIGEGILTAVFDTFKNIDWKNLGTAVGTAVANIGKALVNTVLKGIEYLVTNIDVVIGALWDFLSGLISALWDNLISGIGGMLKDFLDYIGDNLFSGNADEGNNRKDGYVSTSGNGSGTGGTYWKDLTDGLNGVSKAAETAKKKVAQIPPSDDTVANFKKATDKERGYLNGDKNSLKSSALAAKKNGIDKLTPTKTDGKNFWAGMKENITSHLTGDKSSLVASADSAGAKAIKNLTPTKADGKTFWTGLKDNLTSHLTGDKNSVTSATATAKKKLVDMASGDYSATINIGTEGYVETQNKLRALSGVTDHTIRFKPIIDKSTTGSLVNGSNNTTNFVLRLDAYANGGFPTAGAAFIAGEAGPELVGTINGRTGVASSDEITGIKAAVYDAGEAEAALLKEQNALLRQLIAKNTNITLAPTASAGKWVSQASNAYRKATGG